MPKSMTGFARVETESVEGKCYGEVRSLNSRYLEISMKLPRSASGYESKLREIAKRTIKRGRLDVLIRWDRGDEFLAVPKANEDAVRWYIELARHLQEQYGLSGNLTVTDVMAFKDILIYEEKALPEETVLSCFDNLLKKLNEEREKEGEQIKKDLLERLDRIEENVLDIEKRWPAAMKKHEEALREKILDITHGVIDEAKILQEMGFYLERMDIAEEISRLKGHLHNFRHTLGSSEEIGRKLDFVIQEMVRETNTIASKSSDLFISERAIQIKVEIEKMREQVQNVE
jgi:uncharacterized protein (TIGR00255 family)